MPGLAILRTPKSYDRVESLGMDSGRSVEPEMVNPDSDLYRKQRDATASRGPDGTRSKGQR